ncbi:MAG: cysteine--tRNA ligase [Dehalococcoidia bacterium]|jgi:cysteinyl-tRNA synthetase
MRIHNTLSAQKEEFQPQGETVKMYVCGVTPYSDSHIGHAMSYVLFDVIRRYLAYRNYKVKYVQNFTDIDDKLIKRANEAKTTVKELAEKFIVAYFEDMDALNIKRADIYPRATEEVPKIIEVIAGLIDKGHAYPVGGDVYFSVSSFPGYGKLSHRRPEDMISESGNENIKKHPMDFALWKGAKPGEPQWDSPWGLGRPGWHIECTAMSIKYLGETIDIHGGGNDLVFPHHENEIAQSEAFTGKAPFARYWIHNGLLQLGNQKMSKSLGNLITIKEALAKHSPDAIRLFILSSHYRSPLTVTDDGWDAAEKGIERLRQATLRNSINKSSVFDAEDYRLRFIESMDDDFNTAQAIAALFDLARDINRYAEEGISVTDAQSLLLNLCGILGLKLEEAKVELNPAPYITLAKESGISIGEGKPASYYIERLIEKRAEAKKSKDWALADNIRKSLAAKGITLKDTPQGTTWSYKK